MLHSSGLAGPHLGSPVLQHFRHFGYHCFPSLKTLWTHQKSTRTRRFSTFPLNSVHSLRTLGGFFAHATHRVSRNSLFPCQRVSGLPHSPFPLMVTPLGGNFSTHSKGGCLYLFLWLKSTPLGGLAFSWVISESVLRLQWVAATSTGMGDSHPPSLSIFSTFSENVGRPHCTACTG